MSNTIDGIRGVHNQPAATESKNQRSTSGSEVANLLQGKSVLSDTVQLTDIAAQAQKAEEVIANTPEVDKAKVKQIKDAISSGSYKVDAERVADQLMKLEADLAVESKSSG